MVGSFTAQQWEFSDLSLFFLRDSIDTARAKLAAAQAFTTFRVAIDRDITELRSVTEASQISKRASKFNLFKRNLLTLLNSPDDAYDVLRPLLPTESGFSVQIDKLIIGLYTMTATQRTSLHRYGLRTVFATLLDHYEFTLSPAMREYSFSLIVEACITTGGQRSNDLLDVLKGDPQYQDLQGKPRKKKDQSDKPVEPATIGTYQPLFLDLPAVVFDAQDEALPLEPQNVDSEKRAVMFKEPLVSRLDVVTGGKAIHKAMTLSTQWALERRTEQNSRGRDLPRRDTSRTDCVTAIVPADKSKDITFMILVGYKAGIKLIQHMDFDDAKMNYLR